MRKNYEPRRPYREFLAAIREELDAAAAPDIRFHESWLRKNVLGEEFLILFGLPITGHNGETTNEATRVSNGSNYT